jgi:hypothetical protein
MDWRKNRYTHRSVNPYLYNVERTTKNHYVLYTDDDQKVIYRGHKVSESMRVAEIHFIINRQPDSYES